MRRGSVWPDIRLAAGCLRVSGLAGEIVLVKDVPEKKHLLRLAADICLFRQKDSELQVLLIRRGKAPFAGCWALPGGRLEADETIDACAARELFEETGIRPAWMRHFANYSDPGRDPRERTVSAAYVAFAEESAADAAAGSDAAAAVWFHVSALPQLAFDHAVILAEAVRVLPALKRHLLWT